MKSARFLTSPNVQVTLPPNWAAISVGPCQSEVWLSITPPISSVRATASRWASQVMLLSPYTSGMFASCRNPAAASTAASTVAGFPSISASGYRRSAVWFLNQASPRLQAFRALTIRSPSACSSMSSQTQPQNVQVASFTTFRLIASPVHPVLVRPNRAEGRTFSQAHGRGSSPGCGEACTSRRRRAPRPGGYLPDPPGATEGSRTSRVVRQSWLNPCFPLPASWASGRDRLDLDFPALRGRHSGSVGVLPHEMAGRRSVGDEDHALRDLSFHASEDGLAILGPDTHAAAGLNPHSLHVFGMHVQGAHDGLIFGVILAGVDLLALLGRAARVHDEAFAFHRMPFRPTSCRDGI